jgi:hypothetical protein
MKHAGSGIAGGNVIELRGARHAPPAPAYVAARVAAILAIALVLLCGVGALSDALAGWVGAERSYRVAYLSAF